MDVIIISRNSQFVYPITKMAIADKSSHKHVIRRLLGFNNFEVLKSHAASLKLQSMESFDIFKIATIMWRYFKVWCSKQILFFAITQPFMYTSSLVCSNIEKNESASGCTLVWEHWTNKNTNHWSIIVFKYKGDFF